MWQSFCHGGKTESVFVSVGGEGCNVLVTYFEWGRQVNNVVIGLIHDIFVIAHKLVYSVSLEFCLPLEVKHVEPKSEQRAGLG